MYHSARSCRIIAGKEYKRAARYMAEARAWRDDAAYATMPPAFRAESIAVRVQLARLAGKSARSTLALAELFDAER